MTERMQALDDLASSDPHPPFRVDVQNFAKASREALRKAPRVVVEALRGPRELLREVRTMQKRMMRIVGARRLA